MYSPHFLVVEILIKYISYLESITYIYLMVLKLLKILIYCYYIFNIFLCIYYILGNKFIAYFDLFVDHLVDLFSV